MEPPRFDLGFDLGFIIAKVVLVCKAWKLGQKQLGLVFTTLA